ncbi:MAG: hypothetical protein A3J76_06075 [Candidatus Moranbacteria bacterium RBG_13_45_13]|nr:MAG: hypothetical protein A3J76_06075 [Candidatus Moranbacteria bacterium RBG_13_45_13]
MKNYTGTGASYVQGYIKDGNIPTSPNSYVWFLQNVGGYSWTEANQAGINNVNSLIPNPEYNTSQFKQTGTSDDTFISTWKAGKNVAQASTFQQYVTTPVTQATQAVTNAVVNTAVKAVLSVVIGVLSIIAYFCKDLVYYAAQALDLTLNPTLYSGIASNPMVVKGWTVVRDVCNLFFLLALLFIAICTILKIEKYHAKKTLLMLIIMALLINFSKPIAVFIFDGSQLLMNFFLGQIGTGTSPSSVITKSTEIANLVYKSLSPNDGTPEIAVQYLFGVVFLFMLAVAFLVTALMLIIRIVAVMLLVIVSPFAFFAAIIPDFSKMSSAWWSALFEYSYYGPAAAFFLLLATQLQNALPQIKQRAGGQSVDATVTNIIHLLTVLVFLYASIIMAKKFGGGAGAAIVGNANRFMKWAGGMTKGGGIWGAGARGVAWGARTTGVSGAVTQKLQQSRIGRLLTKTGREEAQEEREAAVAEKIGVRGAKEKQTRKRAKKYKDEGYSEAALKNMVATRKDEAAALRLAEDGNMDSASYSSIVSQIKDPALKKLLDDKVKEKTIDVYIDYKAKNEAAALAAATPGMTIAAAESQIAGEEYNKMNADNWKNQKEKSRIFTSTYATEAAAGFNNLHQDARRDVGKAVSGKDKVAMTTGGAAIP